MSLSPPRALEVSVPRGEVLVHHARTDNLCVRNPALNHESHHDSLDIVTAIDVCLCSNRVRTAAIAAEVSRLARMSNRRLPPTGATH